MHISVRNLSTTCCMTPTSHWKQAHIRNVAAKRFLPVLCCSDNSVTHKTWRWHNRCLGNHRVRRSIYVCMAKDDPQNCIPQQAGIVKKPLGPKLLRQWGVLLLLQAAGYFGQFDRTIFGMAVPQIQSHLASNWNSQEACQVKLFESEFNPLATDIVLGMMPFVPYT